MPKYEYTVKSNKNNIFPLINELKEKWEISGLDEKTVFALRLTLEEALVNAMKYGNKFKEDLTVNVTCRILPEQVELEITDMGNGFDYNNVPDPTSEENIRKNGGRGVFLIKKMSDKVEFLEGGRKIRIIKFRRN